MMLGEGKNDIPAEELDAIFDGASDDKSATNTFQYRIQRLLQLILLKKSLTTVIKKIFF